MLVALTRRVLTETKPKVVAKFVYNFGIKGVRSVELHKRRRRRGENFPPFLFISVISSCQLRCQGCWVDVAAPSQKLSLEDLNLIVNDAKAHGNAYFGILGGEPFLHPQLLDLFAAHPDCYFQVFTNGQLITDEIAGELARLGNVTPLVSIEGSEVVSDQRRGRMQVLSKTLLGLDACRRNGLLIGVATSVCQTNIELVSEAWLQRLIGMGVHYVWFHTYRVVGPKPNAQLALTPEQVLSVRRFIVRMRARMPIAIVDAYWDDRGEALCPMATGVSHHIGPGGHIEPCPVIQFATNTVRDTPSIYDAMTQSAFLRDFREAAAGATQGCIVLERPDIVRDLVIKHGARDSTQRVDAMAEFEAMSPRRSQHHPGHEIPEEHWAYRFAKKHWFFGFGAYLIGELFMTVHVLKKPLRMIPALPQRPPQANIPQTLEERECLRSAVVQYVEARRETLVPPLVLDELRNHADAVVSLAAVDPSYTDYAGILVNNEVWTEQLATVPFERRLLLLPKCLRVEDKCPAPFDEFGLLCKQCGLCTIQDLQEEAERLGYAVLVAEGSALVMALIQSGKVDAIVGVSCLSVLERAFPYMEAAAIPGVAIPLLQDDCRDTAVDLDWVWNVVHLTSDDRTRRLDLDALKSEVAAWFTSDAIDAVLGPSEGEADAVARSWLAADGKRWRPFLTACAYKALQDDPSAPLPLALRKAAVAVECFHKASLVHDDIEDEDSLRYGRATLHAEHGVPVALNAGDLLLGEGYRLLASCGAPAPVCAEVMRIAAAGHRELCIGQGAELSWMRRPAPVTTDQVIDIFRRKTSPAFQVALGIGAALAGAAAETQEVLREYSDALGIAYQIRDDLEDLSAPSSDTDGFGAPTLLLALACDKAKAKAAGRDQVMAIWRGGRTSAADRAAFKAKVREAGIDARAQALLEAYKEQAIRSLPSLKDASLKGLLRRVIGKVFRVEIKGWCSEFETRDAAGRQAGTHAAG